MPLAYLIAFFLLVASSFSVQAQLAPTENCVLNYRITGFSFPAKKGATQYTVEIASGNYQKEKEFAAHVSLSSSSENNRIVMEVPAFGSAYTWRIIYKNGNAVAGVSDLHHFTTGVLPVDSGAMKRLRVISHSENMDDAYVFVDGVNMLFDLNGKPVWYMPGADRVGKTSDIKLSPTGSITFIGEGGAYEMGYGGRILWRSAYNAGDARGMGGVFCHHEFTKLSNGHYMALVSVQSGLELPPMAGGRKGFFPRSVVSTLDEYDQSGKKVWSWESAAYINKSDLEAMAARFTESMLELHENAFFVDEKNNVIYISMMGISRIVKIQYPSGNVMADYGTIYHPSTATEESATQTKKSSPFYSLLANDMFNHPHAVKLAEDGCLYLNSTNIVDGKASDGSSTSCYPRVVKMAQVNGGLKKVWELGSEVINVKPTPVAGGGGNVMELPGKKLFVSLGTPYGELYIVDESKHVLWSAETEIYITDTDSWNPFPKYRASIVTRKQLEQMIWSDIGDR